MDEFRGGNLKTKEKKGSPPEMNDKPLASGTLKTGTGSNPPLKSKRKRPRLTTTDTQDGRKVQVTEAQWLLGQHLRELGVGIYFEYRFHTDNGRRWRFDIADEDNAIAFECNGGKWHGGHRRGNAIEKENDKLNNAAIYGWRVLQFTNEQILDGRAKAFLAEFL